PCAKSFSSAIASRPSWPRCSPTRPSSTVNHPATNPPAPPHGSPLTPTAPASVRPRSQTTSRPNASSVMPSTCPCSSPNATASTLTARRGYASATSSHMVVHTFNPSSATGPTISPPSSPTPASNNTSNSVP